MSFKTYEDQQRAIAAATLQNKQKQCVAEVYRQRPTFLPCQANDARIVEVIEDFYGTEVVPNASMFSDVVDANPEIVKTFVRRKVEDQKEAVIERIIHALESTNDLHWSSEHNIRKEKTKLSFQSIEVLRARLDDIEEKQRLQKFTAGQLRSQLEAQRAAEKPSDRVILPSDITAASIHARTSNDVKALVKRFGINAVNDRLFGRS